MGSQKHNVANWQVILTSLQIACIFIGSNWWWLICFYSEKEKSYSSASTEMSWLINSVQCVEWVQMHYNLHIDAIPMLDGQLQPTDLSTLVKVSEAFWLSYGRKVT